MVCWREPLAAKGTVLIIDYCAYSEATNGASYTNYAIGFSNVAATAGSSNSSAVFYDSPGNDTFTGTGNQAMETGPGYNVSGTDFGTVTIDSTQGGTDRAFVNALDYAFAEYGNWQ